MDPSTAAEGPRFMRPLADVAPRSEAQSFLPLVVFPRGPSRDVPAFAPELRRAARRYLPHLGAILFRAFGVGEDAELERFVAAVAEPSAPSGPRSWLWCAGCPDAGRPLELIDCRELCWRIPARIRQRWALRGVEYSRHFEPAALRRWLGVQGGEPARLAAFCREHGLTCEW